MAREAASAQFRLPSMRLAQTQLSVGSSHTAPSGPGQAFGSGGVSPQFTAQHPSVPGSPKHLDGDTQSESKKHVLKQSPRDLESAQFKEPSTRVEQTHCKGGSPHVSFSTGHALGSGVLIMLPHQRTAVITRPSDTQSSATTTFGAISGQSKLDGTSSPSSPGRWLHFGNNGVSTHSLVVRSQKAPGGHWASDVQQPGNFGPRTHVFVTGSHIPAWHFEPGHCVLVVQQPGALALRPHVFVVRSQNPVRHLVLAHWASPVQQLGTFLTQTPRALHVSHFPHLNESGTQTAFTQSSHPKHFTWLSTQNPNTQSWHPGHFDWSSTQVPS